MPVIIETKNLTHLYSRGLPGEIAAIKNISIQIEQGEFVGIIGHTGSGKSTLVQHLNGLLKPDSGKVFVEGINIAESKKALREARFKVGLCFQYPEQQLFEDTVYKDIAFGPKNMGLSEKEINERVLRSAEYVGLKRESLEKSPFSLSGGEKRRAAIAGVMAMEPKVLVLDEPTAGLDPRGKIKIFEMIEQYRRQTGSGVIFISHSMEDVAFLADRVLVLNEGRVSMFDSVENVFEKSEELLSMGLDVPQATKIINGLIDRGLKLPKNIYSVERAAEEIARCLKGGDFL